MTIPLAAMVQRSRKTRRREIVLRPVALPATTASDLYASSYAPIIATWTAAQAGIMAEYERSLAALTTDGAAEIGDILTRTENNIATILLSIRLRLQRWGQIAERQHRQRWSAAVKAGTGIDIGMMIGPETARETVGATIERNVGLVRSVSEQARTKIGEAVFRGLSQRKPAREVAAEIREGVAMSRRRALRIAGDQNSKLSSQLNTERAREAGLEFYEWMHSFKAHPRPEHVARNGQRFEFGHFGDDEPGLAPFCGCVARATLSLDPNEF